MAPQKLRFRSDGSFTIVQFTDIHWHNTEPDDLCTRALMERVLDAEKPDLVALTGDMLGGKHIDDPALAMREVAKPMEERCIPWAAVFGNHDDEASLSRAELMDVQRSLSCCLSEPGPQQLTGIGNYALRVVSARDESLAAALYFVDSNSYSKIGGGQYAWIARDQIAWYLERARALRAEYSRSSSRSAAPASTTETVAAPAALPALAFFHIPLPEYDSVWDQKPCRGFKYEEVCCPVLNSGFFAAMVEAGDVMGTFVGHDHTNDYEGELSGIRLCYGRGTGYACYGKKGYERGARVIRLREGERRFSTWLRLADGSVIADPVEHAPKGRVLSPEPLAQAAVTASSA